MTDLPDHFFRHSFSRLVPWLVYQFGLDHLEDAEDIVNDTLETALMSWEQSGLPRNPDAWLTDVARKKAINRLRRKSVFESHVSHGWKSEQEIRFEPDFTHNAIQDQQLRMIFTCCHPSLPSEQQISLALRTLCGFGIKEIASALQSSEASIEKRLYRAKAAFRQGEIRFEIPDDTDLHPRLSSVYQTVYLLFNEGYFSSGSDQVIREDLCLEAIRLCRLLIEAYPESSEAKALLALMLFHAARFDARLDHDGLPILFLHQERENWDNELISEAMHWLEKSQSGTLSSYHLKAGIASEYCIALSMQLINWPQILHYYIILENLEPSYAVRLNRLVAQHMAGNTDEAMEKLQPLMSSSKPTNAYLLHAVHGYFLENEKPLDAAMHYQRSVDTCPSVYVKSVIESRLAKLQNPS
ncbi:MAG: sigma-70 family RNA polymerase sigma factor [Flavobacteriales bacterium]